jgi:serine/threonine protein kinase/Flp pilus assembly protein TadD
MAIDEKAVFIAALAVPDAEEREAYLQEACAGHPELLGRLQDLLSAHEESQGPLDRRLAVLGATVDAAALEGPGTVIGLYKLLQHIGEGGMGTVYMAEQTQPVQRKVALKVVKPGMDSRQVIARFEAERQALAMMDHVNIARVFDGGATETGRPYFVMELVHGVPITKYCDDNHLTPRQRLELFVPVCQAIQHAHQKGIIHRDIKPSNVMVTLYDGKPVPKVIDFGVAKATEQKLTERTLFTQYGTMVGTLEYMSPEQAEMSALSVDTRSDIYSLGVLLYELVTGSTPLTHKRMKEAAYAEILRLIKEEEPPKPSTRLSDSGEALLSISANRHTEPAKLTRLVRGELDWIVMKALEKDRNRRYETASAFTADVQRYLYDEPVQACPPSAWYRFGKFARRNRGAFVAASTGALLLLVTVITLALSNARICQEQARTNDEKDRAEKSQKLAQDRADEIQRELEGLKAANALLERGHWYAHDRRWDEAQAAFTKAIQLRPDHVSAWVERGDLYAKLGLWDLAAADFARDIELREPNTTLRWYLHALLRLYVGDAEGGRQASLRMRERFRGTHHLPFIAELVRASALAPGPETDLARLVELSQNIANAQPWSSYFRYILGCVHYRAGQYEQAIQQLNEALTTTDWTNRLLSHPVLAMAHFRLSHNSEARQALDETARIIDRWTADRSQCREEYWVMHQGAEAHWPLAWWDWLECWLLYREAKSLIDGVPPPDDPRLHVLRARSLAGLRWNTKAQVEYAEALKLRPHDRQIQLEAHRCRAYCFIGARQWSEAASEFAQASEWAPDDVYLWWYQATGQFAAREVDAYRKTCANMLAHFEKNKDQPTACYVLQACVLMDDAVPDMARLIPLADGVAIHGQHGSWTRGAALYRVGRFDESIRCFEEAAKMYRPRALNWIFLAMAHHRLGHADRARRCLAEAAGWINEANGRTDEANPGEEDGLGGVRPAWGDWHEPVVFALLLREAEELLKNKPGVKNQEPEKKPN